MMLTMSYSEYLNKVHGGWLGKCIGGTIGARMENHKDLLDFTIDTVFPEIIPPNDDLDLQILWLHVLEQKGAGIDSRDLADGWLEHCWYPFNEYGYFVKNYRMGIAPPYSGVFNNDYFSNSMGCPIRSEIWGFICPGDSGLAAKYAHMDGVLDHDSLAVYGEQFFAALEAQAFFEHDIFRLIDHGLQFVPKDSELTRCVRFVIDAFHEGLDWKEARLLMLRHYASPDASHCVQNIGLTVLALLFGRGDFTETMMIAVNSGYDTDCTAATSGAILGQLLGANGIPALWLDKMGTEYVMWFELNRRSKLIKDLAEDTCAAGLSLIRDRLLPIEITDIPEHIRPSLPKCTEDFSDSPDSPCSIEIQYEGNPSIGYGETARVTLILHNQGERAQTGIIHIHSAESLVVSFEQAHIRLEAGEKQEMLLTFRVKPDLTAIPQTNLSTVQWLGPNGGVMAEEKFGLAGAARVKIIGPFWDIYDTRIHQNHPFYRGRPSGRANFNNYVNIDKAYIDESFEEVNSLEGTYANLHTDKFALNDVYALKGQACVYVIHNVYAPTERDVFAAIGHNDAYKFWLNGELKGEANEHTLWMPFNDDIPMHMKKGHNQLIFKVVRSDSNFEFSFGIRGDLPFENEPNFTHWYIDFSSLIEPFS
ncbi:ADP-ribosylglycohydrolase family protein [Paenibacillus eucommiae]|uniref:ADP-ribosylglycohydrolase n=1 Tax=Paenibacillus eucommiae TaxID=1355755 RepID=A0ABS4J1I8_9BACL|nr:ADP-ribosylglycohydrolase family protein [Paenibacillus eucommiae]MBP1992996.1 ADP-ribosylglycohydrolase [Paenibacillus eucommiae]